MKPKIKILVFISVIALTILACSTLTDSDNSGGDSASTDANILYEDDFSSDNSGWDQYSDSEGFTDYENGAYKIGIYTDTMFYWANPYQDFGDVIVEVEAQKTGGGDDMQYGIICRHSDVDNWYVLVISGDGWASIRKRYQGSELEYIADWVEVSSINTGNSTNMLRAECVGSRLSLYVNGSLAVETNDPDISSGDAGLMAGTFDQSTAEVLFDNFVVRRP